MDRDAENLRPAEAKLAVGETACALGRGPDAVCDGKQILLQKGVEVSDKLRDSQGQPLITEQEIKKVQAKLVELTGEKGKFAGIYVNCLGKNDQGEASALTMLTVLDYLTDPKNASKTSEELLREAYAKTQEVIVVYQQKVTPSAKLEERPNVDLAVALVEKNGHVSAVNTSGQEVAIFDKDGNKKGESFEGKIGSDGKPEIQTANMQDGDKIILCSEDAVSKIDGKASVDKIVETLVASGKEKETKELKVSTASDFREPLLPHKKTEDRIVCENNWGVMIDGAGGSLGGEKAADVLKKGAEVIIKGGEFTVQNSQGNPIEIKLDSGLSLQGMTRAAAESSLKGIAINLNRVVREVPEGAACIAMGQPYLDADGKLAFSYLTVGDAEIAIVKKDGTVVLVPNNSVRQLADDRDRVELYLSEREASAKLLQGQDTGELKAEFNVGSLDLEEGDRVVFLSDGVAEDLQNIRGTVSADGKITPQRGSDNKMIGLDILGKIDPNTPIENLPQAIFAKLDEVRNRTKTEGVEIVRKSATYDSEVKRKIIDADGLHLVVGGKGPTQDRGYDDGESIVCLEVGTETKKVQEAGRSAAAGETKKEETQATVVSEQVEVPVVIESKQGHKFPHYEDTGSVITVEKFREKYPEQVKLVGDLLNQVKGDMARNPGESDIQWELRILKELEKRLKFPGDYVGQKDQTCSTISGHPQLTRSDLTLMAVEAEKAIRMKQANQDLLKEAKDKLGRVRRRDLKTEVTHAGEPAYIEGDYEYYFDEKTRPKELPKTDLYAFTLVADQLLDIVDPATRVKSQKKEKTYRQQMKEVEKIIKSSTSTPQQRDEASRRLVSLRSQFYSMTIEAMRTLDQPQYVNPDLNTQSAKDKVLLAMYEKLNQIRQTPIEDLINQYQGVTAKLNSKNKDEIRALLAEQKHLLLEYALKGADLMQRRISYRYEPKFYEIPDNIHYKKFVEGPATLEEWAEVIKPPAERKGKRVVQMEATAEGEEDVTKALKKPKELTPAPTVIEVPVEVAPVVPTTERRGAPPAPSEGEGEGEQPPKVVTPPEELETNVILGAAALRDRRAQNVLQNADHLFSHDLQRIPVPRYAKVPVLGGILWGLRHPVKMIWQNGLARSVFEQQWIRFSADTEAIVKQAYDQSIPTEVTPELLDKTLDEGRAERGRRNIVRRGFWKVTDFLQGLTGIGQTSEQRLAKQWLRAEMQKPRDQWDPQLQRISQRVLTEQTKLGDRYAKLPEGMTLDQANRFLAREAGETRHELPENLRAPFNQRVKTLIEQFSTSTLTEEQLVAEINAYLLGDLRNSLSPDLQKEFSASEVASNILSLANNVKANWERYKAEKGESGKSKWEEYQTTLLFGKGEWGGVRGKKEMGFLAERLARRLSERPDWSSGAVAGGVALAKDFLSNAAFFAAGYGLSGFKFASNIPLRTVGGLLGVGVGAGLKETGVGLSALGVKGIKGRYLKEIEQLSREAARGRLSPNGARIREEMKDALVKSESAIDLTANIERLLEKKELTEQESKQLLVHLANVDARIRLSALAGSRQLRFKVQNFIEFTEGAENEEYTRLTDVLEDGIVKLQTYASANPSFTQSKPLFTATGIQYGTASQQMGLFDQYSALIEAQLTVSSDEAKIGQWLKSQLKFSQTEVDQMMQNIYQLVPEMKLGIQQSESLRGKESLIRKLTLKRGVATVVRAVATGAVAPLVYGLPMAAAAEVPALLHDIQHAGGIVAGIQEYAKDWGDTLGGNPPIEVVGGQVVADLSALQKGALMVKNIIEPPPGLPHDTVIDGVHFTLGGSMRYTDDGTHDYLVDIRNSKVYDLTGFKLEAVGRGNLDVHATIDFNGDGRIDLADNLLAKNQFNQMMAQAGMKIAVGPDTVTKSTVDVLKPSGTQTVTVEGRQATIPVGTHFQLDKTSGKYDLVLDKDPNKVLINDASFDGQGHMTAVSIDPSLKYSEAGGAEVVLKGPEAVAEWEKHGTNIDHREWYSYDKPGSQGNELRLHTYKDGDAVILDMSKMQQAHQQGLNPNPIDVQQVIKNHEGGFALSLPGHTGKPEWISDGADGIWDGKVRLDPNDSIHTVTFADGSTHTLGEVAQLFINQKALSSLPDGDIATEVFGRQNVFNLGLDGKMGYIEAGQIIQQEGHNVLQTFATIRGASDAQFVTAGGLTPILELTSKITDTVTTSTPTFTLISPPLEIPALPFIPIPMRQNIEKSIRAEGKVEQPAEKQTKVTTPSDQPVTPPPKTLTEEERNNLLKKKEEEGLTDEEEEKLAELEAALEPPEEEGEKMEDEEEKEDREAFYEQVKKRLNEFIQEKSPAEIVRIYSNFGIDNEGKAKELKEDEQKRNEFVKHYFATQEAINELVNREIEQMNDEERKQLIEEAKKKLTDEEKEAVRIMEPIMQAISQIYEQAFQEGRTISESEFGRIAEEKTKTGLSEGEFDKKLAVYQQAQTKLNSLLTALVLDKPEVGKAVEERTAQIEAQIEEWEAAEAGIGVPKKVELPDQLPEDLKVRITKALEKVQADPENRTRWQEEFVETLINQLKQEGYLATDDESHRFYKEILQMPEIGYMGQENMYELPGGAVRTKNNQPIIYFHPLLRRKDIPQPLQYPSDYQLYAVLEEVTHLIQMQEKIKKGEKKLEITWEDELKVKDTLLELADFLGFDEKRKEWIRSEREKVEAEVEAGIGVPPKTLTVDEQQRQQKVENLPADVQQYLKTLENEGKKLEGKDLDEFLAKYENLGLVAEALLNPEKAKENFWNIQVCQKRFQEALAVLGNEKKFRTPRSDGKPGAIVDLVGTDGNLIDQKIRKVYFVGDLHGNKWYLARLLENPIVRAELASGEAVLWTGGDGVHGEEVLKNHPEEFNSDDQIALSWETLQAEVWLKTLLEENYYDLNGNHDLGPKAEKFNSGDIIGGRTEIDQRVLFYNFLNEKFGQGMTKLFSQYLLNKPILTSAPGLVDVHGGLLWDKVYSFNMTQLNNAMLDDIELDSLGPKAKKNSLLCKLLWGRSSDISAHKLAEAAKNANANIEALLVALGQDPNEAKIIAGHVSKKATSGRPAAAHMTMKLPQLTASGAYEDPEIRRFYRVHAAGGDQRLYVHVFERGLRTGEKMGFLKLEDLGCKTPENMREQIYSLPPIT